LKALDQGAKRAVIEWHRRSGKDVTCWNYLIKQAVAEKGNYYYFFPTGEQARQALWENIENDGFRMINHIPNELINRRLDQQMFVELKNGSTIKVIGSDKFEQRNVGTNPKGVVFSEYSITEPQVWGFVRPILKVNKGWAIFNFTPRGVNHAVKTYQIGKENNWFTETLTIDDTKVMTKEEYEQELAEGMPQDLAEQEYYCKRIEGASSVFRKIDANIHNEEIKSEVNRRYQIGIDLAKHQDFTVLTAIDSHTFQVAKQERFNKLDWDLQKENIIKFIRYWNSGKVFMDTTGIGDPIFDDLTKQGISIEPFRFTEISREQLLNGLKILLEQNKIKIPNDEILTNELKSFQYELTGQKVKMKVPSGLHDDMVMSLALAVWGLSEKLPLEGINFDFYKETDWG
jgi:hypothetical protein